MTSDPYLIVPQVVIRTPSIGPIRTKVALGYSIYSVSYSPGDRAFFSDSQVSGPVARIDFSGRIGNRLTYALSGSIEPFQHSSESPATSGSSNTVTGYALEDKGGWLLTPRLIIEAGYIFQAYRYNFSGTGSRGSGVSNAVASDQYAGSLLGLRYEF